MTNATHLEIYNRHAQLLWNDSKPFPITVAKLIRYIQDRQRDGLRYNSLKNLLYGLKDHPTHGPDWRDNVFRHVKVLAVLNEYSKMQQQEDKQSRAMSKRERSAMRAKTMTPPLSDEEPLSARPVTPAPDKRGVKPTGFIVHGTSSPSQPKTRRTFRVRKLGRLRAAVAVVIEPPCSISI